MKASLKRSIVFVVLIAVASIATAQSPWDLPEGSNSGSVPPGAFPEGMVGPVTFAEPEFIDGTQVDGLTVTTLNGDPLPAPLSFGFSSSDATVGDVGPGDVTYVPPNAEHCFRAKEPMVML